MDVNALTNTLILWGTQIALKALGALVLWIVGRRLIAFAADLVQRALRRQAIEPSVVPYAGAAVSVLLNIALIVAILGYFGIETTTFAALMAAAGLAIGAAWSGLLANFAAGAFLLVLRPFKVGDEIQGAGVAGIVQEIGLFVTTINTPDNVRTFIGNNKLLSDTMQNFSANPYRRVDLVAQLDHSVDPGHATRLLKQQVVNIPNVNTAPAPDVEILTFTSMGPVLAVRPYCHTAHYDQVVFDTNRMIRETFGAAGFPAPQQHFAVRGDAAHSSHNGA